MDKILKDVEIRAMAGDTLANQVYLETLDLTQQELADYVATHDADLRKILGVKNLVEKDGNPELSKEYFDLLDQGKKMQNPDPYKRQDYYGQDLKDVDYYMDKLGVPKENGEYTREIRAAFTNDKSSDYYGNQDLDRLKNLAWIEGYEGDEKRLLEDIGRAARQFSYDNEVRGYTPEGDVDMLAWTGDLAKSLLTPRVREAKLMGRESSWKDWAGDLAELGLSLVPGTGIVNRVTGKAIANWPKTLRIMTDLGINAGESAAIPVGSQAVDMALYDNDDPRGQWDWERVGGQYLGAIGAKGAIKMGAGTAKNAAELNMGKDVGGSSIKGIIDAVENIGEDSRNNLAIRGAALKRQRDMSLSPEYKDINRLTSQQIKSGFYGGPEHSKAWMDFDIRQKEAERLGKSLKARETMEKAEKDFYKVNADYQKLDDELQRTQFLADQKAAELEAKRNAALAKNEAAYKKMQDSREAFYKVNEPKDEIVQLQDGTFVPNERGVIGGYDSGNGVQIPKWRVGEGGDYETIPSQVTVMHKPGSLVSAEREINVPFAGKNYTQTIKVADRDKAMAKALAEDKDFNTVLQRRDKWQKGVNTGANAAFNAAAREGWVGNAVNLDEKRQAAAWNKQLSQLRPLVKSQSSPESKRQMVDAIMNVMNFGLDELPEEMYKRNPLAYKAIAKQLGSDDWSHWSENKVKDYPTTSY